jgi:hypothetical protein
MITLSSTEWNPIELQLWEENPASVMMIRSAMRRELGFTVRRQSDYTNGYCKITVYLDFYDADKETFFRLKYL